jgi:SAM-dependent methyltransferase
MLIGPEKSVGDEQSRMNRSTRGQWDWYAAHRRRIEQLIVPEARGGSICVLGAGNCNDLDLRWLTEVYRDVELVDIDPSALHRAVERQRVAGKIRLRAPVDLTGVAEMMKRWRGRAVADAEVEAALAQVESMPVAAERFDVVLSPCVLSQLLVVARDLLGASHSIWPRLKTAIRARHLREIVLSTKPGGRGVLVVDLSSTSIVPGLDRAADQEAADLMQKCVDDAKCFRGLEPAEIAAAARKTGSVSSIAVGQPWIWHLGWGKAFLCYGMTIR